MIIFELRTAYRYLNLGQNKHGERHPSPYSKNCRRLYYKTQLKLSNQSYLYSNT